MALDEDQGTPETLKLLCVSKLQLCYTIKTLICIVMLSVQNIMLHVILVPVETVN